MILRKLHRNVGVIFAPFLVLTAVAGSLLLLRRAGLYDFDTQNFLIGLHNWEIVAGYLGIALACALAFMAVTGSLIFYKIRKVRSHLRDNKRQPEARQHRKNKLLP